MKEFKKFMSLNEWREAWLNEAKERKKETYSCVMLDTNIDDWKENHISGIDPKDVYVKPYDDSYGVEDNPHVTVLYGIHEDEIDPEVIYDFIKNEMSPVTVTISKISIFSNDEYDVVKYEVPVTKQLKGYRDKLIKLYPNTQTFPDYNPHITLAYVKSGEGSKYVKELDEPFDVTFNKGVYSWHDKKNGVKEEETTRKEYVFPEPEDLENEQTS